MKGFVLATGVAADTLGLAGTSPAHLSGGHQGGYHHWVTATTLIPTAATTPGTLRTSATSPEPKVGGDQPGLWLGFNLLP